jgi:hypothetical protein
MTAASNEANSTALRVMQTSASDLMMFVSSDI